MSSRRFFPWSRSTPAGPEIPRGLDEAADETELEMMSALTFALRVRDPHLRIVSHCTRVTVLVDRLADDVGLDPQGREDVINAARLHEIGMITVPVELVLKAGMLTPRELERVRRQAAVGAEIVAATHEPRTARIIRNQYLDFEDLRGLVPEASQDVLLSGILRVADVVDAILNPRPYQEPHPRDYCKAVLERGAGTRFHPRVVAPLLEEPSYWPRGPLDEN